ncbi:MAG: UDP-N-acetylmuramate dehydrogenase [Bacilli bacterium]|nr:UDP-N-acetylmuramate dehydrogenase [Bacilli bacterium]
MKLKSVLQEMNIGDIKENEEMSKHTTYKVGGECSLFVTPSSIDNLICLLKKLKELNIKYKILGNGSNVIFSSNKYDGVIINLCKINKVEIYGEKVYVEAGYSLIKLTNLCANNGLSGIEFASGIPGAVGGAIYMNAGAYKSDMSEIIEDVTILDENLNIKTLKKDELDFSYRHSIFMEKNYIILSTVINLNKGKKEDIVELMNNRRQRRIESQPLEYPSAGSVFRNPSETIFSGKLIEDLGLKGYSIGGAKVSEKHANFIVNYNNATAEDIMSLISFIKEKVKEKYNIELKVEQEFVNF